jgi:hypothetical protein
MCVPWFRGAHLVKFGVAKSQHDGQAQGLYSCRGNASAYLACVTQHMLLEYLIMIANPQPHYKCHEIVANDGEFSIVVWARFKLQIRDD